MFFKPRYKFGEITKRWGDADFKKDFDGILDNWINQFSADERPLLLELLKNFYYYNPTRIHFGKGAVSFLPEELSRLGYSEQLIHKLFYGNALAFIQKSFL